MNASRSVSVIGLGRVGLPLALCFADRGLRVLGDRSRPGRARLDPGRPDAVRRIRDPGAARARARVRASRSQPSVRSTRRRRDDIVITIGTPSFSHIESDLRQVRAAVDDLLPMLRPGHALILRSTIAPGTTEFVAGYIEKRRRLRVGEDLFVAHTPERIAAGRFLEEISTLPCIIGGVGEASTERAAELFAVFGAPIVQDHAGPGRAREDLDEHPPLHDVRAPEPPDDGLRALRRERVRRDRPDQPRLPPGRDRPCPA